MLIVDIGILNTLANSITLGALGANALVNTLDLIASVYFVTSLIRNSNFPPRTNLIQRRQLS